MKSSLFKLAIVVGLVSVTAQISCNVPGKILMAIHKTRARKGGACTPVVSSIMQQIPVNNGNLNPHQQGHFNNLVIHHCQPIDFAYIFESLFQSILDLENNDKINSFVDQFKHFNNLAQGSPTLKQHCRILLQGINKFIAKLEPVKNSKSASQIGKAVEQAASEFNNFMVKHGTPGEKALIKGLEPSVKAYVNQQKKNLSRIFLKRCA